MKKAIYTVITGNYDELNPAPNFSGWDCFLFTDQAPENPMGWQVIKIKDKAKDKRKLSRKYKLLVHKYLPEYEMFCYIDGNGIFKREPIAETTHIEHAKRKTVKEEYKRVIGTGKDDAAIVRAQIEAYRQEGFTDNLGLYSNNFFIRPNNEQYNKFYEMWYTEVEKWSYRDQLSLPYVLWKAGVRIKSKPPIYAKRIVDFSEHKSSSAKNGFSIHHITPGRSDKLFGKAIAEIVDRLPDNDWICLRDIDTIPLDHITLFRQLEDIVRVHGHKYDLFGAMTNDIGLKWQQHNGELNRTYNLEDHYKITKELSLKHYIDVVPDKNYHIAGFFMLFSKKIWNRVGKLTDKLAENGHFFDYVFSKAVQKAGGKTAICKGVYIYHFCRYGKPRRDTTHLYN